MKLLSGKKVLLLSTGKNKTFRVRLEYVDKFKCSFYISVMKFTVEKLPQAKAEMEYVYVKDSEGYVFKKRKAEVTSDEKIISEKEYMKTSGLAAYEKEFGHGGARENHLNYSALMQK